MKKILLTMTVILFAHNNYACEKAEAQFIGIVSQVQTYEHYENIDECFYKIKFTEFAESNVCAIDEVKASTTEFYDSSCSLKVGTPVSGYLVEVNGVVVID